MSVFVLTRWKTGPDGREPDLPEAVDGFAVLFSDDCRAVLSISSEHPEQMRELWVCDEAAVLLESGLSYIPAMARARQRISKRRASESDEAFVSLICDVLQDELERQPVDRAALVRSNTSELGYRNAGEYVWGLLMSDDGTRLTWAASDAEVYTDPVETFDISEEIRRRLSSVDH